MGVSRTYSTVLWLLRCGVVSLGGGGSSCAFSGHFGLTHTLFNRQGPNKGPTWGCPTASRNYSRAGCR